MSFRYAMIVGVVLAVTNGRAALGCDYEWAKYPSGASSFATSLEEYVETRPHASGSGIRFIFNKPTKAVKIRLKAGLPKNTPPSQLRIVGVYSDGYQKTVYCDGQLYRDMTNWLYYQMTNYFGMRGQTAIVETRLISLNSDMNADVRGIFYPDTDADGIEDAWEPGDHGTDPEVWDTDGDGLSDGEEVNTSTDPLNPASYFRISGFSNAVSGSANFAFVWPGAAGKSYRMERCFDPVHVAWSVAQDGIPAVSPATHLNVQASPSWTSCFFRVVQTNDNVIGRNAVGYIKVNIPRGNLMMIQSPFENLNGSGRCVVGELLGSNFPRGAIAYLWNKELQQYKSEGFTTRWIPGTNTFSRGAGVYVKIPGTAASNSYDIFMTGEVPDRFTAPASAMPIVRGMQMVGFMYPVSTPLTNTALATTAKRGDIVYYWKTNQTWGSEGFVTRWIPGTFVLDPGQAFYYQTTNATVWTETKPYTWP